MSDRVVVCFPGKQTGKSFKPPPPPMKTLTGPRMSMFYPVYRSDICPLYSVQQARGTPGFQAVRRQETDGRRLAAYPFFVAFTAFLVSL